MATKRRNTTQTENFHFPIPPEEISANYLDSVKTWFSERALIFIVIFLVIMFSVEFTVLYNYVPIQPMTVTEVFTRFPPVIVSRFTS